MKRKVFIAVLALAAAGATTASIVVYMTRDKFTQTDATPINVHIPIDCTDFVVTIDGDNELEWTNEKNVWVFTNTSIIVGSSEPNGKPYNGDVYRQSDGVWTEYEDKYIIVSDSKKHLLRPAESLQEAPVDISYADLLKENKIKKLSYTSPERSYVTADGIVVRDDYVALSIDKKDTLMEYDDYAVSYITDDGYVNAFITYGDMDVIIEEETSRLFTISGTYTPQWYKKDNVFFACVEDRYVGIKRVNLNTFIVFEAKGESNRDYCLATIFRED